MLGTDAPLHWEQTAEGLRLQLPPQLRPAADYAVAFRIAFS